MTNTPEHPGADLEPDFSGSGKSHFGKRFGGGIDPLYGGGGVRRECAIRQPDAYRRRR